MSEDKETLLAMGFAPERIDWALRVKKGQGLQTAMDFILAHADDPVPEPDGDEEEASECRCSVRRSPSLGLRDEIPCFGIVGGSHELR